VRADASPLDFVNDVAVFSIALRRDTHIQGHAWGMCYIRVHRKGSNATGGSPMHAHTLCTTHSEHPVARADDVCNTRRVKGVSGYPLGSEMCNVTPPDGSVKSKSGSVDLKGMRKVSGSFLQRDHATSLEAARRRRRKKLTTHAISWNLFPYRRWVFAAWTSAMDLVQNVRVRWRNPRQDIGPQNTSTTTTCAPQRLQVLSPWKTMRI